MLGGTGKITLATGQRIQFLHYREAHRKDILFDQLQGAPQALRRCLCLNGSNPGNQEWLNKGVYDHDLSSTHFPNVNNI